MEAVVLDSREPLRVACPEGEECWQVVLTRMVAVPVRQQHPSGLWVHDRSRPQQPVVRDPDNGEEVWTYRWPCGDGELYLPVRAWDRKPCLAGGSGRPCRVYATKQRPPDDYYVNPRHGQACGCCGHQGTHVVYRDGRDLPRCMATVAA